nr:glycine rich protein [Tanacetum cinerariifolium]
MASKTLLLFAIIFSMILVISSEALVANDSSLTHDSAQVEEGKGYPDDDGYYKGGHGGYNDDGGYDGGYGGYDDRHEGYYGRRGGDYCRSRLIVGICLYRRDFLITTSTRNETAKDLWDALERQMRGSEYGEQDRKATILYEYETFKANEGEQLLDTYLRYLQNATLMRQTKNLMDINIDALYNILKQSQGDVNDALGYKKKAVVVHSDPLALVAEKTNVSKRKEKVVVSSYSKGSGADDFSELKKITALLAKAFNKRKFYSKPTNNNLRTSSTSQSANKKQEFIKTNDKKADEKRRDMSKVKCYNYKKEGHFAKDYKQAKVKDYNYYKTKMLLAKKDSDEQVLLAEDQA